MKLIQNTIATVAAVVTLTGGVLVASAVSAQTGPQTQPVVSAPHGKAVSQDAMWLMKTVQGNMVEIELGRLALTKSTEPVVISFANRMIADHGQSLTDLRALAATKRLKIPTVMNDDQTLLLEYFRSSTSPDWGHDYIKYEIVDHNKDIAETQKEISEGRDADAKAAAMKSLPVLQDHLRMAQDADKALSPK